MMVLEQANRKHRYVLSPPNECVNIVALILYIVSVAVVHFFLFPFLLLLFNGTTNGVNTHQLNETT